MRHISPQIHSDCVRMTTGGWNDPAYPYSPHGASPNPDAPQLRKPFPWQIFWRWAARIGTGLAVVVLLALSIIGTVFFRAALQAWRIAELERLGANVWFHANATGTPNDERSDRWWSDVREVSHHGEGYLGAMFSYNELTKADVQQICALTGRFTNLQKFEISSDLFSCSHIKDWPRLAMLEELSIVSAKLTDDDLAVIGRISELKTLRISKARISTAGIAHLARLPKLETLTLLQLQFANTSSKESSGFSALKTLVVSRCPGLDDETLSSFATPPLLQDLNFNQTPIGDKGLAQLLQGGNIQSLIIDRGALSDAAILEVAKHKAPGWLVLSGMPITDAALAPLAGREFPTLILDNTPLTDQCFETLAKIKGLEYLSLSDTKVTGIGVKHLDPQQVLKELDLSGNKLTREGLVALSKTNCSKLTLSRTSIGDREILLFAGSEAIEQLDLTQTSITPNGVQAFYANRRNYLKTLGVTGYPENLFLITDFHDIVMSILGLDPNTGDLLAADNLSPQP